MDYAINGAGGDRAIVGSDTLIFDGEELRFHVLQWHARRGAEPDSGVLELPASGILNQYEIFDFLARMRSWARTRLDARHASSPRLLILPGQAGVALVAEATIARFHYVVSLCARPCSLLAVGSMVTLNPSQMAAYDSQLQAEIKLAQDAGDAAPAALPEIIMDGLLW